MSKEIKLLKNAIGLHGELLNSVDGIEDQICNNLQEYFDFPIHMNRFDGDGLCVMSEELSEEGLPVGMPVDKVIELIERDGRVDEYNWFPTC